MIKHEFSTKNGIIYAMAIKEATRKRIVSGSFFVHLFCLQWIAIVLHLNVNWEWSRMMFGLVLIWQLFGMFVDEGWVPNVILSFLILFHAFVSWEPICVFFFFVCTIFCFFLLFSFGVLHSHFGFGFLWGLIIFFSLLLVLLLGLGRHAYFDCLAWLHFAFSRLLSILPWFLLIVLFICFCLTRVFNLASLLELFFVYILCRKWRVWTDAHKIKLMHIT